MAIPIAPLPEGTRVKVMRGSVPQDPALIGRSGTVIATSEYNPQSVGVVLNDESAPRYFLRSELEILETEQLPPERQAAKRRPALP
jgi:hypothetical protein